MDIIMAVSTLLLRVLTALNLFYGGAFMELSERKKAILSAIVRMYINSGEPIGSKVLCEMLENAPSSATLRNEMNALCDMGFLSQPHTSAGRVPTHEAYRFYVETLMPRDKISEENKYIVDSSLNSSNCDPEKLPERAVEVLSELTGLPSIAAKISDDGITLKRVELLPMGMHSAMLIIITSDGRSRSQLCHVSTPLTSGLISQFDRLVTKRVIKQNINSLTPAAMQCIIAQSNGDILNLMSLINALFQMVEEIKTSCVSIKGMSNLFAMGLAPDTADKIGNLISSHETVMSLISKSNGPLSIVFGNDTDYNILKPSSIILAKYGAGGKDIGCIGVIGPTRMSYEHIIPSIKYTASRINSLLGETLKDMED